jgi:hypothetical protein
MKQNMCVTIDIDVHTWLRNKKGKLSTNVNRILLDGMIAEKKKNQTVDFYCWRCDTTQVQSKSHPHFGMCHNKNLNGEPCPSYMDKTDMERLE